MGNEGEIPQDVRRFIAKHIRSLEQLEVLLLVSALPDRDWTVDSVFQVVQTNRAVVQQRLEEFVRDGLMLRQPGDTYRYAPQSESLAHDIIAVGGFYKLSRHKVVEMIYASPPDDIRKFSDAFRIKKGNPNG
ncbi:MAG TPA: hypothetical protein VK530_21220 [Candidatus Acidoferrum sp.]|nr:hypothetical protein [Candidatus Acidoferrum sp.]